jgi:uncharacterized phage protein (TIGR02216 family)
MTPRELACAIGAVVPAAHAPLERPDLDVLIARFPDTIMKAADLSHGR